MGLSERFVRELIKQHEGKSTPTLTHFCRTRDILPELREASRRILAARGVTPPELEQVCRCPACKEGVVPPDNPNVHCPACAFVSSQGKQDPDALRRLVSAFLDRSSKDPMRRLSTNPLEDAALVVGRDARWPAEAFETPWFRVLVPARDRLWLHLQLYAIPVILCALVFLTAFAGGLRSQGLVLNSIIIGVFYIARNRLAAHLFSEAFNRRFAELMPKQGDSASLQPAESDADPGDSAERLSETQIPLPTGRIRIPWLWRIAGIAVLVFIGYLITLIALGKLHW